MGPMIGCLSNNVFQYWLCLKVETLADFMLDLSQWAWHALKSEVRK